jgi:high-affinity Fe2+/Pb2+ permease
MFVLSVFFVIFMILRYSVSGCETPLGMLIGTTLGGVLGYGWYQALRSCGLGQFDDIFGIKTQLIKV